MKWCSVCRPRCRQSQLYNGKLTVGGSGGGGGGVGVGERIGEEERMRVVEVEVVVVLVGVTDVAMLQNQLAV